MNDGHSSSHYPQQFKTWVPGARVWSPDSVEIAVAKISGKMNGLEHYYIVANRAIDNAMTAELSRDQSK